MWLVDQHTRFRSGLYLSRGENIYQLSFFLSGWNLVQSLEIEHQKNGITDHHTNNQAALEVTPKEVNFEKEQAKIKIVFELNKNCSKV